MSAPAVGFCIEFTNQGTYVGRANESLVEDFPDPTRLFSALIHAASTGPDAVLDPRLGLRMSVHDQETLLWLEANPPTAAVIPPTEPRVFRYSGYSGDYPVDTVNHYRATGIGGKGGSYQIDMREYTGGRVILGVLRYGWTDPVPARITERLTALAGEVAYLGDIDSEVRITWESFDPEYHSLEGVSPFDNGYMSLPVPAAGRLDELEERHRLRTRPAKYTGDPAGEAPAARKRRESTADPRRCVMTRAYAPVEQDQRVPAVGPWSTAVWFPLTEEAAASITDTTRTAWAVAAHRTLVRAVANTPAVPVVTGWYPQRESRLANNVSYQFIPDLNALQWVRTPDHRFGRGPGLLVSVPTGINPQIEKILIQAIKTMRILTIPGGQRIDLQRPKVTDARYWWTDAAAGTLRRWLSYPLVVPECDTPRAPQVINAALNYALRAHGPTPEVKQAVRTAAWLDLNIDTMLHKYPKRRDTRGRLIPPPLKGVVTSIDPRPLETVVSASALLSIGQTRHLSGGLLIPVDSPISKEEKHVHADC